MLYLEIAGLIALQLYDLHYALSVFQQCHYHRDRYRNWIADHFSLRKIWKRIRSFLPFLFFLFLKTENARSPSILCVILIYLYVRLQRRKEGKNIAVSRTSRLMRLAFVLAVLDLITTVFVRVSLSYELYVCLLPLLWMLGWILLPVAAFLVYPIEMMIQNRYVNDAKMRLRSCPEMIRVGISGSYGKTSVKHIAYELVKDSFYTLKTPHSYNNRMGITKTIRESLDPLHEVFLCEMGSDHSGELKRLLSFVDPQICIVTAIGPQHLSTFGSMEAIIKEKMTMIEHLPETGIGIINADNRFIREYPLKARCSIIRYGHHESADVRIDTSHLNEDGTDFVLEIHGSCYHFHTKLLGECNVMNITAAVALARALDVPISCLQARTAQLPYVEHRLEMKKNHDTVWIDDAYNSNPQGAAAALDVLAQMPGWKVLITPGMIELGNSHHFYNYEFGAKAAHCADEVILVGNEQVQALLRGLQDECFCRQRVHQMGTMKEALVYAESIKKQNKVILIENDVPDLLNH